MGSGVNYLDTHRKRSALVNWEPLQAAISYERTTVIQRTADITGLPSLLADETLYSWASRYHRLTGFSRPAETSCILFGDRRCGLRHDFPSGLKHLVRVTKGALGSTQELIDKHTLLPYFLRLKDASDADDARKCLHYAHIGGLKYRLGLLTSRFRAHHPLKACPACLQDDNQRYGFSYWHTAHQWPGAWACTIHSELLISSIYKVNGIQRFQWLLPDTVRFQSLSVPDSDLSADAKARLSRLSKFADEWSNDRDLSVTSTLLRDAYLSVFRDRRWLTSTGRTRLRLAAQNLASHLSPIHWIPEFAALPSDVHHACSQLTRLLGTPRGGTHPLRHIVIIEWLFADWYDFKQRIQKVKKLELTSSPKRSPAQRVPAAVATEHAFTKVGVFRQCTGPLGSSTEPSNGRRFEAPVRIPANVTGRRRPKKLKALLRAAVTGDLERGEEKQVVMRRFELSIATVNRLLREDSDLYHQWQTQNRRRQRNTRREAWKGLLRQHGSVGPKEIRSLAPALYAWLYRHDRVWLDRVNRCIPRKPGSNNVHTDWLELDKALAAKVVNATLTLRTEHPARHIELWELCAEIPELRARLAKPRKYPRTLEVIDHAKHFDPGNASGESRRR